MYRLHQHPPMPESSATASRLAGDLLRIGAVKLSPEAPFTWASGLRSPVYCDNRLTIGHPEVRRRITDGFVEIIRTAGLQPQVIAGTATAGIPHAAWLADRLGLPMVYVRSKAKGPGTSSRLEGRVDRGRRVYLSRILYRPEDLRSPRSRHFARLVSR